MQNVDDKWDVAVDSSWVDAIRALVETCGSADLELPSREPAREPLTFD